MSTRSSHLSLVLGAIALLHPDAEAGTIRVPADHPTIQQAIDAAVDGDTVLVGAGTYVEMIDFKGKAILVTSASGADLTTIDGNRAGSVVTFATGEGNGSILEGFTIQGGTGTWHDNPFGGQDLVGGGVLCLGASPIIRNNVLHGNDAYTGAGIYCGGGGSPLIRGNRMSANVADNGGGIYVYSSSAVIERNDLSHNYAYTDGGGLCAERSTITLIGNAIVDNGASEGGGISPWDSSITVRENVFEANWTDEDEAGAISLRGSTGVIENNRFVANRSIFSPSVLFAVNDSSLEVSHNTFVRNEGYGVIVVDGQAVIEENTFSANQGWDPEHAAIYARGTCSIGNNLIQDAWTGIYGSGTGTITGNVIAGVVTGIRLEQAGGDMLVSDNRITRATDSAISLLSDGSPALVTLANNVILDCQHGIGLANASPVITGNVIARCAEHAIGIDGGSPVIVRNTIAENAASDAGAGILIRNAAATITSNIVWGNTAPADAQIFIESGSAAVTYCDVQGGWPGTGNIDADPLFVAAATDDWRLQATSPCIDAGDPADRTGGQDVFGEPRFLDGDLDRARVIDMGAAEFDNVQLAVWRSGPQAGDPFETHRTLSFLHDASLVIDTSGTAGLPVFLFAALAPGETDVSPYGPLFFDLAGGWLLLPWGTLPSRVELTLPDGVPLPMTVILQELALDAPRGAGNTSNPVTLSIR